MPTLVLDLPGLSQRLLDRLPTERRPAWLQALIERGASVIEPVLPAVTMPAQATYTTGVLPEAHGVVANGVAGFRCPDVREHLDLDSFADHRRNVSFWEQSNNLLQTPRVWSTPGQSAAPARVALLFFQSSISAADIVVTPKPEHGPDGSTLSACWTSPPELAAQLDDQLGTFPLHRYWGPATGIEGSKWIVAAAQHVWQHHRPDVQLTYIPHLDYDNQKLGPSDPRNVEALAEVLEVMTPLVEQATADGARIVLLSEYGMTDVHRTLAPNVLLREAGLLVVDDRGEIDYANSAAFALCDHQVAHVYCIDSASCADVANRLAGRAEVASIHFGPQRVAVGLDTPRAGDAIAFARTDSWFEYRWWSDGAEAPDYAWTIDIHRKPGYDPTEMFAAGPLGKGRMPRIKADQPELVKGSHGTRPNDPADWPVLLGCGDAGDVVLATEVFRHMRAGL